MGSDEMGSYYRDPNLKFLLDERYNPHLAIHATNDHNQHPEQADDDQPQETGSARHCSVRGCTSLLPPDYSNKMCDACRGRHRIYASTKRAKRKMEKAAMGVQNGWASTDDDPPANGGQPSPPGNTISSPESVPADHPPPSFPFPGGSWESTTLDPRLFQPSTASELAGALTLPAPSRSRSPIHDHISAFAPGSTIVPEGPHTPGSISAPVFPYPRDESVQPNQQTPHKGISVQSISEVAAIQPTGSLPPRFCSIKGCKTVMDGNALYKMCDICRSKYKTYGTTKRKKWKEEKAKALAELERVREEENRIRAEQGLPPLPNVGTLTWPEESIAGRAIDSSVPRMCTVSHCREVLPIGYGFLRCERHRIQNRHHSKLKRVRDKDAKAQALEGFCATIVPNYQSPELFESPQAAPQGEMFVEGSSSDGSRIPIAELYRIDEEKRSEEVDINVIQNQVVVLGVPPAARGVRRTNHVCCIKGCHNLLSPATPWKMCDDCRAHERTVRKIRALRENGVLVEPLPPRLPPKEKKVKAQKVKKIKPSKQDKVPPKGAAESHDSTPGVMDDGNGGVVFMDPILLDKDDEAREPSPLRTSQISFVLAGPEGNVPAPPEPVQSSEPSTADGDSPSTTNEASPEAASVAPKKKGPKKKTSAQATPATDSAASASAPVIASSSGPRSIAPAPGSYPPYPYYPPPPPPGYGMPYPSGTPYPYPPGPVHAPPAFPRDGFAPSPMYQPPYSAYAGYPPPYPPPYGYYPSPYGPYPPPPPPPVMQPPLAPEQSQPPAQVSANESAGGSSASSTSPNPPPAAGPGAPNYTVGVISYVSAAAGAPASAPSSMSPDALPPPPSDPSSMYSMFSVKLPDAPRAPMSTAADTEMPPAAALNGSAPVMQVMGTNNEKPKEGVIWVDRMPEKRKRRKADHAAVQAYMKKREQEKTGTDGEVLEGPAGEGDHAESSGAQGEEAETACAPVAGARPVQHDVSMRVDPVGATAGSRLCANKMCGRTLTNSEIGTICNRCKERMKKRAMKVKRRHKLVMPSSSKAIARHLSKPLSSTGDGEDGMEEVMVEEALARSHLHRGTGTETDV